MKTNNEFHICPLNVSLAQTRPDTYEYYDDEHITVKITLEIVNPRDNWGWDTITEHIEDRLNMLKNFPWINTEWCMGDTDESIDIFVITQYDVKFNDSLSRAMSAALEVLNNFLHSFNKSLPTQCGCLYTVNNITITPAESIPSYCK